MFLSILARILIGFLLIIHGFAHYNLTTLWGARPWHQSWLPGAATLGFFGSVLWVASLLVFLAAGIVTFTNQPLWRALAIAGAAISLLTMGLFWDPKMIIGAGVNAGVLVALIFLKWPAASLIR